MGTNSIGDLLTQYSHSQILNIRDEGNDLRISFTSPNGIFSRLYSQLIADIDHRIRSTRRLAEAYEITLSGEVDTEKDLKQQLEQYRIRGRQFDSLGECVSNINFLRSLKKTIDKNIEEYRTGIFDKDSKKRGPKPKYDYNQFERIINFELPKHPTQSALAKKVCESYRNGKYRNYQEVTRDIVRTSVFKSELISESTRKKIQKCGNLKK
jgi:hypothetical protein